MSDQSCDVVIVGAGPVGLGMGRMLGLAGHTVVILEQWREPYRLPRAVHFDDEIGRIFQSMGLTREIQAISEPVPDFYEWHNTDGDALVRIDWSGTGPSGWPTANFFNQPELEKVLADAIESMPTVTLLRGAEVVGLEELDDEVVVTHTTAVQKQRRTRARFVVGCDGANSFVRERIGTTMQDHGFFFDWLIVDTVPREQRDWSPMNWQLCDPARPTTIVSGGPGRRRWEFMRLPGETREELNTTTKAWALLEPWGRTPANSELERHAVYTFAARWADQWHRGRLLIAGDAAHQMPPFAGQGMCSGLRDVANLGWKLDRVLRGQSDIALLDTYTTERSQHVQYAITMSIELGRVICVLDDEQAAERDARMIADEADPARVLPVTALPVLGPGVLDDGDHPLRGTLAPQFPVRHHGEQVLLDEATGDGPVLLVSRDRRAADFDAAVTATMDELGGQVVSIAERGDPDLGDPTGAWTQWFAGQGVTAVLLRPDHYIFGVSSDDTATGRLVDTYLGRVGARVAPTAAR